MIRFMLRSDHRPKRMRLELGEIVAKFKIVILASVLALAAVAARTESLTELAPREAIAVMPEGKVGRVVVTDDQALSDLLKVAKPIPWCVMLLRGEDGKVYLVNTDGHNPMVACEEMVP